MTTRDEFRTLDDKVDELLARTAAHGHRLKNVEKECEKTNYLLLRNDKPHEGLIFRLAAVEATTRTAKRFLWIVVTAVVGMIVYQMLEAKPQAQQSSSESPLHYLMDNQ